jgi:large subunit ribosomal protein L3
MNQNLGIIGKKVGMTQIFTDEGLVRRVTIVEAKATVVGKRTLEKDGYSAVILGIGERKEKHTNKAQLGEAKKAGTTPKRIIRELRLSPEAVANFEIGKEVPLNDVFQEGQFVDVQGITRGRGFTGVMRRWNFKGVPATHGTHEYRRHGGSIGTNMTPGRTLPNLKMGGQYGNETVTTLNLTIAKIMPEDGLLLIDGSVPGAKNGTVVVRVAVKKKPGARRLGSLAAPSSKAVPTRRSGSLADRRVVRLGPLRCAARVLAARRRDIPSSPPPPRPRPRPHVHERSRGPGKSQGWSSQGWEAALTKSRICVVSRTPSKPNCRPSPSGLFHRTVAGIRTGGSNRSSTETAVPNGYCLATPTNMPPILRSVASPLDRTPSGPSMTTLRNTSLRENLRCSLNGSAPFR